MPGLIFFFLLFFLNSHRVLTVNWLYLAALILFLFIYFWISKADFTPADRRLLWEGCHNTI